MIFEQDSVGFSVLDVLSLKQKGVRTENGGRNFSALSFRYPHTEVRIETERRIYDVGGAICYFPAHFDYTRIAQNDDLIVIHFNSHTYYGTELEMFVPQDSETYRALFEAAFACWQTGSETRKWEVSRILCDIFALAFRECRKDSASNAMLSRALAFIARECFRPDLTVSEIAHELYVSEVYLRRLFREAYGCSPKRYILQRRLDRAVSLLETRYYTVSEVAELSGFADPRHFSTVFKKEFGSSPSAYKYDFKVSSEEPAL